MQVRNDNTGFLVCEDSTLDEIEFGVIPNLPPGDYVVENDNGDICMQHRKIVERWVRYPYTFRIE